MRIRLFEANGMNRRKLEEAAFKVLMIAATFAVAGSLFAVVGIVLWKGLPALDLAMITQTPKGGYYLGKEGGILNAIVGSLYLAFGATALTFPPSLLVALFLQKDYYGNSWFGNFSRFSLDVLWGVPSIVYGAFGFTVMIFLGMKASLLAGILVLALLEFPIMIRAMEEAIRMVSSEIKESSYALGLTRFETMLKVVCRQALPGILTAVLLAFGRGIGDAASILFTTGYTDQLPASLFDPVASLPLAVFFQLGTPFAEVQQRAYASAAILLVVVLATSLASRLLANKFMKYVVR